MKARQCECAMVLAVLCRPCTVQAKALCVYLFMDVVWLVITNHRDRVGMACENPSEMITVPVWTPAGVCILGRSRSQYFRFEQELESTLRSVQEPIKNFKRHNLGNDACCQTEWN